MGRTPLFLVILLSVFLPFSSDAQISKALYDSLPAELKPSAYKTLTHMERAAILNHSGRDLVQQFEAEFKKIAAYADNMIAVTNDVGVKILYTNALGNYYINKFDNQLSFDYFIRSISYPVKDIRPYAKEYAESYSQLAIHYSYMNMQDTAIEYLHKAMDIGDRNDTAFLLTVYNGYFMIYSRLALYEKQVEYIDKYIGLMSPAEKWDINYTMLHLIKASCLDRMYETTMNKSHRDSAEKIISAIMQAKKSEASLYYGECFVILGDLKFSDKEYKQAISLYDSALSSVYVKSDLFDPVSVNHASFNRIECRIHSGDKKAIQELETFSLDKKDFFRQSSRAGILYKNAMQKGNFRKALEYYVLYTSFKDSLDLVNTRGRVFEANQKYSVAKKESEIRQLENINLRDRQRQSRILITGVIILSGLLLIIMFLYSSNKRQQNMRLLESRRLMDQLNSIEREMELSRIELKTEKDAAVTLERRTISRNIHDEISSSLAALRFLITDIRTNMAGEEMVPVSVLYDLEQEALAIYQQSRSFIHQLNMSSSLTVYDVGKLLRSLEQQFVKSSGFHIIVKAEKEAERSLNLKQHTELYRIIRESVANSMKHSNADTLTISLCIVDGRIYFEIKDNGKGFQKNKTPKGIGIEAMHQRAGILNGTLKIESSTNGTTVSGSFPVAVMDVA